MSIEFEKNNLNETAYLNTLTHYAHNTITNETMFSKIYSTSILILQPYINN